MTGRIDEVVTKVRTVTLTLNEEEANQLMFIAKRDVLVPKAIGMEYGRARQQQIESLLAKLNGALYGI